MRGKNKKGIRFLLLMTSSPFVFLWRILNKLFRHRRENFELEVIHEFDSQLKMLEMSNLFTQILKPFGLIITIISPIIGVIKYPFILVTKLFSQRDSDFKIRSEFADETDAKIIAIQRSTRTLFKFMVPPHNWLRSRLRWYYNWHIFSFASQVHWASLAISTITLVGFLAYTLFPFNQTRAQNYDKVWTSTADFDTGSNSNITTASDQTKLSQTTTNFSEGFTGTTYEDAVNTTANWDTSAHKVTLPGDPVNGVPSNLEDKWKLTMGSTEGIKTLVYDSTNGYVYIGGTAGGLVGYNISLQTITNLTPKIISDISTNPINSLAFDQTNKILYVAANSAKWGALVIGTNPATSTWSYLGNIGTFSTDWSTNNVLSLSFDQTNQILYLGGFNGKFGALNGGANPAAGTWYYLTTIGTFATDWGASSMTYMTFDSTNNILYLGGGNQKIGAFNGSSNPSAGTWYYLTGVGTFSADLGAYGISSITFDTYGFVYVTATNTTFGIFTVSNIPSNDTWTNIPSKITADFSTTYPPRSSFYDSTNRIVYIGGDGGKFGAYNGGATPASGTYTSLTSKISADWSTNKVIQAITFDTTANLIYIGGSIGSDTSRFGAFNGGATPSSGTWTNLTSEYYLSVGYLIYSSVYDSLNGYLYLGGESGKFGAYKVSDGTMIDLTSKISANWSTNGISALTFDSTNGIIYLGGLSGKFGAFAGGATPSSGTWYYLTTVGTFSTNWSTNQIYSLAFDSHNGIIYLGGFNGKFGAFAGGATPSSGTWYYLTTVGTFSTNWSTNTVSALAFDSVNYIVYLGGSNQKFGAFNGGATPTSGSWISLSNAGPYTTYALTFDPTNNYIYLGGSGFTGGGSFGYFATSATPSGSAASLSVLGSDWPSDSINSLAFANNKIFMVGTHGKFAVFSGGATPASGTYTYLQDKLSSFWSTARAVKTITSVSSNATMYLCGDLGNFASYLVGYLSNKDGISAKINSTAQTILKATLTVTETKPANTAITYYLSSNGGVGWNAVTSGVEFTFSTSTNDLRWKANLTTTDLTVTPEVTGISISYTYYTSNSGTMNLQFNASQSVAWISMNWNKSLPANTSLSFKIKGASSQVGLAGANWSDAKTANQNPINLQTINVGGVTGLVDSQWSEIQVDFSTTDGLDTPLLYDLTLNYTLNSAPELQNVTASGATDGSKTVNISYQVRDVDTNSNSSNPGEVSISFQYSTDSGSIWNSPMTVTNTGLVSVNTDQLSYTTHTAVWNIGADLANSYYNNTVEIKVIANDNELAHNTAELASSTFSIDTKLPTVGAIGSNTGVRIGDGTSWTNSSAVNLTLLASDDMALQMLISNNADFSSGSYEVYSTSKTGWSLSSSDGNKTVYVRFKDIYGNTTDVSSSILLDTTPPDVPANLKIYDNSESTLSRYSLTVIFDPVSASDLNNYVVERSVDNGTFGQVIATLNSAYTDLSLTSTHTYSYRVKSTDIHNNSSSYSTTVSSTPSIPPDASGLPNISGTTVQKPGAAPEEVTIIWTTDKYSTSQVWYGTTQDLGLKTTEDTTLNKTHYVRITNLSPSTKYYYKAYSKDAYNNVTLGDINTFETGSTFAGTAAISSVTASDITLSSAIISWKTSVVTTSVMSYGKTESYGNQVEDQSSSSTTVHTVRLSNLDSGTTYYFRVSGKSQDGTLVASDNYKFSTLALPQISNITVKNIGSVQATIGWSTNNAADSYVDFGSTSLTTDGEDKTDQSQGNSDMVSDHTVTLVNLKPATKYQIVVKSRDVNGNQTISEKQSFTTIADTTPPKINDLKSETSIITDANGESKAQAIISWSTDEPATSQIKYAMGVSTGSDYSQSTTEDSNLTTSHIMIISNLQLSATYHMIILSKDASSNLAVSEDYTVLTQNQDKSLVQYIVQILEERFFWLKRFGIFGG